MIVGKAEGAVVEDETFTAMALADSAEDAGATVIGPVSTVFEALELIKTAQIDVAIIDADLADIGIDLLAMSLVQKVIPFVVHAATDLPDALTKICLETSVVIKPAQSDYVVATVLAIHRLNGSFRIPIAGPRQI